MKVFTGLLLLCAVCCLACSSSIPEQQCYNAGYMYWYTPSPLSANTAAVLLGTVSSVQPCGTHPSSLKLNDYTFRIEKLFYADTAVGDSQQRVPDSEQAKLMAASVLKCPAADSLSIGDRVVVFLIPYEGGYAVPRFGGTNCTLGIKIRRDDHLLIRLLQAEADAPDKSRLRVRDSHLEEWRDYDPEGACWYAEQEKYLKQATAASGPAGSGPSR
ncbi:MAG: hypothetical protein ABFD92_06795 [Planctomycetaceae bacterium]|nr:hypothetical protein [Planctomycetaceae bacterium]